MDHISLTVKSIPGDDTREMLIAYLFDYHFDSFNEGEDSLEAFIPEDQFSEKMLGEIIRKFPGSDKMEWDWCRVRDKNWNAEWEKDYRPVTVAGKCYVRAPFHPPKDEIEFDIIIAPKMSFGTAHHGSTRLMLEMMLESQMDGKTVIDMGCGTAVLAILANKMGAAYVYAIDNNDWAVNNARENVSLNQASNVEVIGGDASALGNLRAEILLANINRNVLLDDMEIYEKAITKGGTLVMSGFLEYDLDKIDNAAKQCGLEFIGKKIEDQWVVVSYMKK